MTELVAVMFSLYICVAIVGFPIVFAFWQTERNLRIREESRRQALVDDLERDGEGWKLGRVEDD